MATRKTTRSARLSPADVARLTDEVLENCSRRRMGLQASLKKLLPRVAKELGAIGAFVRTKNEDLQEETFAWGIQAPETVALKRTRRSSVALDDATWLVQPLDLDGKKIGVVGFAFDKARAKRAKLLECIEAFCEELDGILSHIHTAAEKQTVIEKVTRALSNRVLTKGLDQAVALLHKEIKFDELAICFRDEINPSNYGLQYRIYAGKNCTHDSESSHHRILRAAIEEEGNSIIDPERNRLAEVLGLTGAVESVLISGITRADAIGKVAVAAKTGLNTFSRDLLRVFAGVLTQRLVDYRRERLSLARFFEPGVVSHLLRDPDYRAKFLTPREEEIAIVFADINGFTKMCETAIASPRHVGEFVDRWSDRAVEIAWEHGGVFDKMIGDCIIALFGPPFFTEDPEVRAENALKTALEIQEFTVALGKQPEIARLVKKAGLPGLAVGVGVNLCKVAVGHFGPNEEYTAFGTGMNETARLQSEADFQQILVMEPMWNLLQKTHRTHGQGADGPLQAKVKNVPNPLRFFRLT